MDDKDNWLDDEWGNLGNDDVLLNPKINYIIAAKDRMSNEKTRNKLKASRKKQNTPQYLAHMSKQRLEKMDKVLDDSGLTLREKITEANRRSAKDPVAHKNRVEANRRLKNDPIWQKTHKKACREAYAVAIQTPYGVFECKADVNKHFNHDKITSALPHLFYPVDQGPGEPVYSRFVVTPQGTFATIQLAYDYACKAGDPEALKLKLDSWWMKCASLKSDQYYYIWEESQYYPMVENAPIGAGENFKTLKKVNKETMDKMHTKWNTRVNKYVLNYKGKNNA